MMTLTKEELIARIRQGHQKIWHAWDIIKAVPDEPKKDRHLADWDRAMGRLHTLASQLIALGGVCVWEMSAKLELFGSNEPLRPCLVCPIHPDKWCREMCPAWNLEL